MSQLVAIESILTPREVERKVKTVFLGEKAVFCFLSFIQNTIFSPKYTSG